MRPKEIYKRLEKDKHSALYKMFKPGSTYLNLYEIDFYEVDYHSLPLSYKENVTLAEWREFCRFNHKYRQLFQRSNFSIKAG